MTRKPSGPPLAPAGAAAIARRGRVGLHGQVLAQQGGGDGAIGELHHHLGGESAASPRSSA